jgi:hypothetical protein
LYETYTKLSKSDLRISNKVSAFSMTAASLGLGPVIKGDDTVAPCFPLLTVGIEDVPSFLDVSVPTIL